MIVDLFELLTYGDGTQFAWGLALGVTLIVVTFIAAATFAKLRPWKGDSDGR